MQFTYYIFNHIVIVIFNIYATFIQYHDFVVFRFLTDFIRTLLYRFVLNCNKVLICFLKQLYFSCFNEMNYYLFNSIENRF